MRIGHRPRPVTAAAPAIVLANGAVTVSPCPLHFDVTTSRRRDGSLVIRIRRTVEL